MLYKSTPLPFLLKKAKLTVHYDWKVLESDKQMKAKYRVTVENRCQHLDAAVSLEEKWKLLQQSLVDSTEEVLPKMHRAAKQQRMKQEILDKMKERRNVKLLDMDKFQKLNKEIRKMCKQDKEEWLNTQ